MNITGYLAYHEQDPVSQSTRDFSTCQIRVPQRDHAVLQRLAQLQPVLPVGGHGHRR